MRVQGSAYMEVKNTLKKEERIYRKKDIDHLFSGVDSFVVFPFKVVFFSEKETDGSVAVLISVPKKKIRSAAKRNRIKRLMRETYRTGNQGLKQQAKEQKHLLFVGFIYLDNKIQTYAEMKGRMQKALGILKERME